MMMVQETHRWSVRLAVASMAEAWARGNAIVDAVSKAAVQHGGRVLAGWGSALLHGCRASTTA